MAVVWIPSLMRSLTGGAELVTVSGATLREVIEDNQLRPHLAAVVDGELAEGLRQRVQEKSEIQFIPAISGGR
jgi:molybdopterin converting factor small subunit